MAKSDLPLGDWDLFVLRHRKRPNICFHVVSFGLFWLSIPIALIAREPWWLAGFFISGFVGTAGHYLFGDGTVDRREASSSPQAVHFSSKMVLLFLSGRYRPEIEKAERRLARHLRGEIESRHSRDYMREKLGKRIFHEQESVSSL